VVEADLRPEHGAGEGEQVGVGDQARQIRVVLGRELPIRFASGVASCGMRASDSVSRAWPFP
jgi:hypothetical protein